MNDQRQYLAPTYIVDSDSKPVKKKARNIIKNLIDPAEQTVNLFYFVRDGIKYNPYDIALNVENFRASYTLQKGFGFCVSKAVLLAALARATGIPARIRFANLVNHQVPQKLFDLIKDHVIYYHGFCEFFIKEKWISATPAFDNKMCREAGLKTVEFDGKTPAILPQEDLKGRPHIDYLKYHQLFHNLPMEQIREKYKDSYTYENTDIMGGSDEQSLLGI